MKDAPDLTKATKRLVWKIKDPEVRRLLTFSERYTLKEMTDGFWQTLIKAIIKAES